MASIYDNVLSNEELDYFNHPDVILAKSKLDLLPSGMVYFSLPNTIQNTLSRLGIHSLSSRIPMRWIKGDTAPHLDVGSSNFTNTFLIYLNDSPGELIVDSSSYPIQSNCGVVFNEGLRHETRRTENVPRLLIGPMNEFAEPVGSPLTYYPTEADALAYTNALGYGGLFIVDGISYGYTSWRLASNSTGTSPQNVVYMNGNTLNSDGGYNLYPSAPCFLEGTTILCQIDGEEKYIPIEEMNKGTLVKTSLDGYKQVVLIGKGIIQNPGNDERTESRLYKCSTANYPQLKDDLYITGCHSILEYPITDKQKEDTIKHLGNLFVTDKKYRLMACLDERAEPWNSKGEYTIWHFALEHNNEKMNYGVYANGLLVESCNIHFLKNKSNMILK